MRNSNKAPAQIQIRNPMTGLWRIAMYYVVLLTVAWLLGNWSDLFWRVVFGGLERLPVDRPMATDFPDLREIVTTPGAEIGVEGGPEFAVAAVISLLGALALMIPVAWVYLLTKQRRGYDESVVQAMLILPIAVAGMVFIVKYYLGLAFALAGIVAAVRFRTTLQDTKDAVYVFLAIGVGLAAGAFYLSVAGILSIVFNGVILYLFWSNFGNIYADQRSRTGALGLADVLAGPGSASTAISMGDPQLLEAMTQEEIRDVATRVARMDRYLRAEQSRKKKERLNALLILHAEQFVGARNSGRGDSRPDGGSMGVGGNPPWNWNSVGPGIPHPTEAGRVGNPAPGVTPRLTGPSGFGSRVPLP